MIGFREERGLEWSGHEGNREVEEWNTRSGRAMVGERDWASWQAVTTVYCRWRRTKPPARVSESDKDVGVVVH